MAVMEFGILGPLEVRADGREVPLGGAKPRALLAVLALHPNQPVSAERVAVALWGEDTPPRAVKTVQVYVARLRKALGDPDVLVTTPGGYCLRVRPGELDAERFERQVADGRLALAAGRGEAAAAELREALGLWRGPPLAELASAPFAPAEIARLEEQHLAAVELRVEADLAAGRHAELVGELQQLTSLHPWRERLHAQLMLALYRSGRQADALEAYRRAREILVEQLGLEPGAELRELHEAVLDHDPRIGLRVAIDSAAPDRHDAQPAAPPEPAVPAPPNRTIGRERELSELSRRLQGPSVRLLTLTGTGGVGKTRLGLELARNATPGFADGTHFVSLAAVQRPEEVPAAIVSTLGIILLSGELPSDAVERFLAGKQLLLVADNFEHVLAAGSFLDGLLAACPGVTVLATSREPLGLQAEERYPVSPLELPQLGTPEDPRTLAGVDAITLFSERARGQDHKFELSDGNAAAVAEICRRLDGLPLAIELAAARCGLLSPTEILERFDAALATPGRGAPGLPVRQQTLRATIDWSHDLLGDDERACFARFAVFVGGATVQATEVITGAELDTLDRLLAKSLLVRRRVVDTSSRLGMLETIGAYAAQRFATAPEHEAIRERHFHYYLALAQNHGTERALGGTSRQEHLACLDADITNLDAALEWAVDQDDAEGALAMCVALGWFWLMRDNYAHAVGCIDRALSLPGADGCAALRARALCIKAPALRPLGRRNEQPATMAEAETIARTLADPLILAQVLQTQSFDHSTEYRLGDAAALAEEALQWARAADDDWAIAMAAVASAWAADSGAELRERVDWAAGLLDAAGDIYQLALLLSAAAYAALRRADDDDARAFISRAVPATHKVDSPYLWMLLQGNSGLAALLTGDTDAAHAAFREELRLCRDLVALPFASEGLAGLAAVAVVRGDLHRAARLCGAAAAQRHGEPPDPVDVRLAESFLAPARSRHGGEAWDIAACEGAALSFAEAIAYALEEPSASSRRPSTVHRGCSS